MAFAWVAAVAIAWGAPVPGVRTASAMEAPSAQLAQKSAPAVPASAEQAGGTMAGNTCVDCHRRKETVEALPVWEQDHFVLWYVGAHGRAEVTCHECHGGDPAASEKAASHTGIRSSRDPLSAIYYKNLPRTCGKCHEAVYKDFVRSDHYKALVSDRLSPSCTTCHGFQMDIARATHSLVERCTLCHNAEGGVKPEVGGMARAALDHLAQAQRAIEKARLTIELARDQGRGTARAEELLRNAQERLQRTGSRWHRFRLRAFESEVAAIQAMAEKSQAAAMRAILAP